MRQTRVRLLMLECFVRIHDRGSISDAAHDLGISQPNATKLLRGLEDILRVELIRRNSRYVSTTASGLALVRDARDILNRWNRLVEKHCGAVNDNVSLRITAPVGLGQYELFDIVADFVTARPGLRIDWRLCNRDVCFRSEGADLGILLGKVRDDGLIVQRLGDLATVMVAAPGHPSVAFIGDPEALAEQQAVVIDPYYSNAIDVQLRSGQRHSISPPVRMRTNNFPSMYRAVVRGLGFAVMPLWFVRDDLEAHRLVDLLPSCSCPTVEINLVSAENRYRPPILETLIDRLLGAVPKIDGVLSPRVA